MFESPIVVLLLVVVLVVIVTAVLGKRDTGPKRAGPARGRAGALRYRSGRRARSIAIGLMVGAAVLLVFGLTQARFLRRTDSAGTVILAIDSSESMSRADVAPTRLEAAVAAAEVFLEGLPAELRVGLVSFAGEPQALVPPTTERGEVLGALGALPRGEGTVIGDALDASLDAIESEQEENGEAPAAIVLLSDGRDTGSAVAPDLAAARASQLEVAVHTVVLGQDLSGEAAGANIELMQRIAEETGGSAFTATTAGGLLDVYETLRTKLSTELEISDFGALFVGLAGVLAVAATVAILIALRSDY